MVNNIRISIVKTGTAKSNTTCGYFIAKELYSHNVSTFTYVGKETTYITSTLKHSNIRIAYRTNNTSRNHLTHNNQKPDKFSHAGVYKLTCPDWKKVYIGQKGCDFITRYNEHRRSFRNNSHTSKSAQHLNEHMHSFGNIDDVMQILHCQNKGLHLNKIERFYIHIEAASNNHLNDDHTITPNRIFDTILKNLPPIN